MVGGQWTYDFHLPCCFSLAPQQQSIFSRSLLAAFFILSKYKTALELNTQNLTKKLTVLTENIWRANNHFTSRYNELWRLLSYVRLLVHYNKIKIKIRDYTFPRHTYHILKPGSYFPTNTSHLPSNTWDRYPLFWNQTDLAYINITSWITRLRPG